MTWPYTETVTIMQRTPGPRDSHGGDTYTTSTSTVMAAFAPGGTVEVTNTGDQITTQPAIYVPPGTNVTAISAVIARGVTWEVDGTPSDWRSAIGSTLGGIEVKLKAVTG